MCRRRPPPRGACNKPATPSRATIRITLTSRPRFAEEHAEGAPKDRDGERNFRIAEGVKRELRAHEAPGRREQVADLVERERRVSPMRTESARPIRSRLAVYRCSWRSYGATRCPHRSDFLIEVG